MICIMLNIKQTMLNLNVYLKEIRTISLQRTELMDYIPARPASRARVVNRGENRRATVFNVFEYD
jgi:hypothetical protein